MIYSLFGRSFGLRVGTTSFNGLYLIHDAPPERSALSTQILGRSSHVVLHSDDHRVVELFVQKTTIDKASSTHNASDVGTTLSSQSLGRITFVVPHSVDRQVIELCAKYGLSQRISHTQCT